MSEVDGVRRGCVAARALLILLVAAMLLGACAASASSGDSGGSGTAYTYEALSLGDSGEAVLTLQSRLIDLGYMSGEADGIYGKTTADAVADFQRAMGYDKPDGYANAQLLTDLYSDSAISADGSRSSDKAKRDDQNQKAGGSDADAMYIANTNTVKFHYRGCRAVDKMYDEHKAYYSSRAECVNAGYEPCRICYP